MTDHPSSPLATAALATAAESPSRPIESLAQGIGKLSDDWSVELSPIAHSRDSLNGSSPIMESIVGLNVPSSPLRFQKEERGSSVGAKQSFSPSDFGTHDKETPKETGFDAPSFSLKSARSVFRNPYLVKEETTAKPTEESNKGSWFLSAEPTTPPMSTSSDEFSLESLNENGSSKEDSLEKPVNGKTKNENQSAEGAFEHSKSKPESERSCQLEEEKGKPEDPVDSKTPEQLAGFFPVDSKEISPLKEVCRENTRLDKYSTGTPLRERTNSLNSLVALDASNLRTTMNDSTSSQELNGTNHSSEMSALIEDATLKVRKFIYELSVLDSSTSPPNSSEEGPQSDSSTSEEPNGTNKDKEQPESLQNSRSTKAATTEDSSGDDFVPLMPEGNGSVLSACADLLASSTDNAKTWLTPTKMGESNSSFRNSSSDESRTPGKLDFTNAKKEVGQSSFEFIQRIRGAAQRRKQNLARSRDSLVAKEREQREAIASSQMTAKPRSPGEQLPIVQESDTRSRRQKPPSSTSFKAKPLPSTTGDLGSGGLAGVPKVAKKPSTVPTSPRLGSRRSIQPKIKALQEPVTRPRGGDRQESKVQSKKSCPSRRASGSFFKARPAPQTTGELGRSGQSGVPKVPKRPVTVPSSPKLGQRRRHSCVATGKENGNGSRRVSTGMVRWSPSCRAPKSRASPMSMSSASQGTPRLLGLDLLSVKSCEARTTAPAVTTPPSAQVTAFEPRSTQRAKKRQEFEARRMVNEQLRLEEEVEDREKRVQKMYKELESLREVI